MRGSGPGGIDCDIHPALPDMRELLPFLDPYWREQITVRGIEAPDLASFPPNIAANCRADWRPADGRPATDIATLRAQALDGFGTRAAICNLLSGVQAVYNPHMASALARATNEWMASVWLDAEPRLVASITIAPQDPEAAAAEIERCAADPRFVQVLLLAMGNAPLGQKVHWPIYEAAQRHRLPIGIHAGGIARHAPTGNGWPSYHIEDCVAQPQAFQAQLLSLVHEGVFAKFPALTVVLIESGFTWLPQFLWRANKTWRAMRAEVPWVDRPPADIIRERVRITLQPTDAPPDPADLARAIAQIGEDGMLLFSTDYPHWQFEGSQGFPAGFPAGLMARVRSDNPLATYPRLQERLQ